MKGVSLETAVMKLGPVPYRALESAYLFARTRGDSHVELVHWLMQILLQADSDLHRIVRAAGIDQGRLAADLERALEQARRGGSAYLDYAEHIDLAIERGWLIASLVFGAPKVRSAHLLLGMLEDEKLARQLVQIAPQLKPLSAETIRRDFESILGGSPETATAAETAAAAGAAAAGAPGAAPRGSLEALQRYTVDLTEQAREGRIDPVTGREEEIRQLVDILMRRRQNNPILVGEAGVGKTAVVEGFALKIANGEVPPALREVSLRTLDVGLLQAGASMKGEFEERLRQVIEAVQRSAEPIVLFIDEAHTLIGAGGSAGTGDAANLLKPALARGTLRTIAATTWGEYKEFIEPDPALTRRFQPVKIEEPDHERAVRMMRGLAPVLEKHHKVSLLDEAIDAAVGLSRRYIPARQLPDKSVSVLDTACARVAVSQNAVPAELEDCQKGIEALRAELDLLERERRLGIDVAAREAVARERHQALEAEREAIQGRWAEEKALVERILQLRGELGEAEAVDEAKLLELRSLQAELQRLQGERPLILPGVDAQAVAAVIADWTGIPLGRMVKDEIDQILNLAQTLKARIIGQDHALEAIAKRIQTARAGLDNPEKPVGVFLLCGTSGVGKTETALALAEVLFGGEQNLISINMSEFQEAHTVSTLKGAPPGYKGYGKGGRLTEAVRRKPYSVVLLDEVEKAHPDVHEIFFQVFDKGMMDDSEGRRIDFKNTLIILTSNVGSELLMKLCADPDTMPGPEGLGEALRAPLLKVFPAALLGRLVTVPYYPLSDEVLGQIIRLQLARIRKRVEAQHKVPFLYDDAVVALIRQRCTEVESGGRMIDAILTTTVLPEVSREVLKRRREDRPVERIRVGVEGSGFTYDFGGGEAVT
ncbi:MAG TPA: type VI secretion system ATPase TssH [Geminicoccaceae bacterium]|nr:type VI secretion system ATPase TssH [Geminicoccaceae bacterium]